MSKGKAPGADQPRKNSNWIAYSSLVISLLSLLSALLSFRSAEQHFRIEKRPWVAPDPGQHTLIEIGTPGEPTKWKLPMQNFGNSPALDVRFDSKLWLAEGPAPTSMDSFVEEIARLNLQDDYTSTLQPGQRMENDAHGFRVLTDSERSNVLTKHWALILGNRITYKDVFDTEHETLSCYIYLPAGNGEPEGWLSCPLRQKTD